MHGIGSKVKPLWEYSLFYLILIFYQLQQSLWELDLLTLLAKKEVLEWLKSGKKTIDIRKGNPREGDRVLFVSGPYKLEMRVVGRQSGALGELVRADNFRQVIPSAGSVDEALDYLRRFYSDLDGVFTAYFVAC